MAEAPADRPASRGRPPGAANVRLFVALELPASVVDALLAWRTPLLREDDALRAVAPVALHVTLAFLGWLPAAAIAPLSALVADSAARCGGVAGLALGEPLWLPRRRPRVLAVALEDRHGQLTALQEQLVKELVRGPWHEPEARPYLPHVTVARVRSHARVHASRLPAVPALTFDGAALALYRSHLSSAGARYEPLSVNRLV